MIHLPTGSQPHPLWGGALFCSGRLPPDLVPGQAALDRIWQLHPHEYRTIKIHGRLVHTPRWQQAYGRDYHYTGQTNRALPVPSEIAPFLTWAQQAIHPLLNGVLLNWYDAALGHYIGKHRDSRADLVRVAPIVTICLGEDRPFRIRPWKRGSQRLDFPGPHGTVFIMPFETNLVVTHEVPRMRPHVGRRISVTLRAFA